MVATTVLATASTAKAMPGTGCPAAHHATAAAPNTTALTASTPASGSFTRRRLIVPGQRRGLRPQPRRMRQAANVAVTAARAARIAVARRVAPVWPASASRRAAIAQ